MAWADDGDTSKSEKITLWIVIDAHYYIGFVCFFTIDCIWSVFEPIVLLSVRWNFHDKTSLTVHVSKAEMRDKLDSVYTFTLNSNEYPDK